MLQMINPVQLVYKTVVVSFNKKQVVDAYPPDGNSIWSLHSVLFKKKRAYYTWSRPLIASGVKQTKEYRSSDADFNKSMQMVKDSIAEQGEVKIKETEK